MNRGKSLPTPHQKQSQIGGAWAVDRSNQRGRSLGMEEANWPEPLGNGGCSDKLPNCNPTVDNGNGYGNFKSSRSIHDALAWTADPYMEALSSEDGCTWAELLALIKAPSDVPANAAANIRISPSNEYVEMNSHSQDNSFISYLSQVERSLESSSNNQDTQIHHPTIEAPYKSTPRKNIGGSDMQAVDSSSTTHLDITSSKLTNQDNYPTFHPQGSINMLQPPREGFPVPYEPQYGLNMPWRQTNAETSIATSCHFAPATPEQPKKLNHQVHSIQNVSLAQDFSPLTRKTSANSEGNEAVEHQGKELMGNILETSFAAISSPLKETDGYGKGSNQDVELNKTPPPKAPKRKKHRPRVVVENKPRRNRRPADPINANSKGNQVTKRKYVRKKPLKGTNNSQGNDTKKTQDSNVEATRSCRRSLNFDSRNQKRDEHSEILFDQQKLDKTGRHSFLSPDTQETCLHTEPDNVTRTATIQTRQWDGLQQDIGPMQTENALSSVMRDLHAENPYVDTNKMNQRANEPYQIAPKSHHVHQYQHNHAGIGQSCLGESPIQESLKITRQQVSCHQQQPETDVAASQARGSKRKHHFTSARQESSPLHVDSSSVHVQESFQVQTSSGSCLAHGYSGKLKKNKIKDGYRTTTSNVIPSTHFAEEGSGQVQTNGGYKSLMNHLAQRISKPSSTSRSVEKPNNSIIHLPQLQFSPTESTERNIQKQQLASGVCSQREELAEKIPTRLPPAYGITSPTAGTENNPQIRTLYRNPLIASHSIQSTVKQHRAPTTSKLNQPITGSQEEQKDLISIAEITLQLESLNINSTNTEMMNNEKTALVPFIGGGSIVPYEILDHIKKRKPRPKVDLDPETNRIWKLLMGKEASEEDKGMDQDKAKWWEEERKIFRGRASSFVSRMRLVQGDRRFSPWKGSVVDSVIGVFLTQNVSDHLSSSAFMSLAARFPVQLMRKTGTCQSDNPVISVEEPEICVLDSDDSIKWQDLLANQTIYNRSPHESLEERRYNLSTGNLNPSSVEGHNCSTEEVISSQDSTESSPCHSSVNFHSFTASTLKPDCPSNGCKSNNTMNSRFDSYPEMENVVHLKEFQSQQLGGSSITMASTGGLGLFDHAGNSKQKYQQSSRIDDLDGSVTAHLFDLNSPYVQPQGATTICYQLPITASSKALGEQTYTLGKDDITYLQSSESGISMTDNVISTSKGTGLVSLSKPTVGQNVQELWQVSPTSIPYATQNKHSTNNTDCTSLGLQAYDSQNSSSSHQNGRVIFPYERTAKKLPNMRDVHNSTESTFEAEKRTTAEQKEVIATNNDESNNKEKICILGEGSSRTNAEMINLKEGNNEEWKRTSFDWDSLRREVLSSSKRKERSKDAADSIDYEAIRRADLKEVSKAIKERGMNNVLADRIKDFLDRLIREHGSIDLEWLRDVPPDKAKDYLLSFRGLGLKSVECVRLLTLHQHAFPVDTNVGRIAVRLGWVPLQPLPESLQLHLLELYPMLETIQKYLWPRLCKLDQRTLYELHYQLITFGKVFCTKSKPNCNACPMRGECRHFASAFASARLSLPGPEEKSCVVSASPNETNRKSSSSVNPMPMHRLEDTSGVTESESRRYEPIVEEPTTPEPERAEISETDIEDAFYEDSDEIPTIKLNVEEFTTNLQNFMQQNMELQEADMSKALVLINQEAASIPTPKLKNVSRLRTEHQVYELPDQHPLLKELEEREPDDPSPYLLAIWTPGETADSIQPPETRCEFAVQGKMCCKETCFSCNSQRESMSQIVRGTLLIPCRTAMRGSFPLNGTYFQVNEVFADHTSSLNPIDVPRAWIWNLPRRPVYFGTSVSSIFKGMSTEDIQYCFWKGFVCVRGFDQKTRAPRPLMARLHFIASKHEKPKVRANNTRTIR